MKSLRSVLFWVHLVCGVGAGLVVLVMSVTGFALVFEGPVLRALEPAVRGGAPLSIDVLAQGAGGVTLWADTSRPALVQKGRETRLVDPSTGAALHAGKAREVFHFLEGVHRTLGAEGDARALGKGLTGAANLAFVIMCLTGLWLWWPRGLTWNHFRAVLWFRGGLDGLQRELSWHHVFGIWSVTALLAISASGVVISYRWAGDLVLQLSGEKSGPPRGTLVAAQTQPRTPLQPVVDAALREVPDWSQLTVSVEGRGEKPPEGKVRALQVTVLEAGRAPPFSRHTLEFDPYSGALLTHQRFETASAGMKARGVLRFLHTGEALGATGQALAAIACVSAVMLVWTGLMLSGRRFLRWRRAR